MCVAIYNQANSHKLFSAQLTLTTESSSIFSLLVASKSLFRTPVADKIWNRWRTAPTIRSTWMWTFANLQVASTCTSSTGTCTCSWSQLLVNHHPDTYRFWLEYQRMRAPKPVLLFCGQPLGLPRYQRCVTLTWRPAPPLVSQGSRVTEIVQVTPFQWIAHANIFATAGKSWARSEDRMGVCDPHACRSTPPKMPNNGWTGTIQYASFKSLVNIITEYNNNY